MRDEHFIDLLQFYRMKLYSAIAALGSDPHKLCPIDNLERDYRKFGHAILALVAFSLGYVWIDDPIGDKLTTSNDAYRKHIVDFATDMIKYGYVDCTE